MGSKSRPSWIVLAPGTRASLEPAIVRQFGAGEDEPCRWEIVEGNAGYVAVVEWEPGSECAGDDDLAMALSRGAQKPAYVLWADVDLPRVQAFVDGAYVGDVKAWPDRVAGHLGCRVRGLDEEEADGELLVDLTPVMFPTRQPGERTIAGWTLAQLTHMIESGSDWHVMLEGSGEENAGQAIAALDDPDAAVRKIACELVYGLGVFELGRRAAEAVERLFVLSCDDPDEGVRAAAQEAHEELADHLERVEAKERRKAKKKQPQIG